MALINIIVLRILIEQGKYEELSLFSSLSSTCFWNCFFNYEIKLQVAFDTGNLT